MLIRVELGDLCLFKYNMLELSKKKMYEELLQDTAHLFEPDIVYI